MSPAERARQFMPFAAVSGVDEANADREIRLCPHPTLSEDQALQLDKALHQVAPGMQVRLLRFRSLGVSGMGTLEVVTDAVQKLELSQRVLYLRGARVSLDDLLELEVLTKGREAARRES